MLLHRGSTAAQSFPVWVSPSKASAVLRNGRDWARLNSQEQLAAKLSLLKALADQVDPAILGARYRALETAKLVENYYGKAKKGPALRLRTLSPRPMERTLSAF